MSNTITKLSEGLAAAVQNAGNSVVRVDARRRLPASGIVWDGDGHIVTANHILRKDKANIGLNDGGELKANVIGRDNSTDLAVLKVDNDNLTPLVQANADSLAVGHLVMALGRPGQSVQATLGIISAVGSNWRTGAGGEIDRYLQTDVIMYPGFSGGPLINVAGEMIGLNSSVLARGVSVTLPNETVTRVVNALIAHGKVKRGYLGVSTQAVRLPKEIRTELGQEVGLLIANVESDSPAEAGGLLLGDTIVSLADNSIKQHDDLLGLLQGTRVGKSSAIRVVRGGKLMTVDVVIGERK